MAWRGMASIRDRDRQRASERASQVHVRPGEFTYVVEGSRWAARPWTTVTA